MKIAFLAIECTPFHAKTIEERPIGGVVTGVIRISEALQNLGHDVTVITRYLDPPPSSPRYIHAKDMNLLGPVDVFVVIRSWRFVFFPFEFKKCFFWTGDNYDFIGTIGLGDKRFIDSVDGLLTVSKWHENILCEASGFPHSKCWVIPNGIHLPFFEGHEEKRRKRLIYSSLPHRGLVFLPLIFEEMQKHHPDLELHIFGSFDRNAEQNIGQASDPNFKQVLDQLRAMSGCTVHGSVKQKELAREMMRSSILCYPCIFEETSCITAMEAQAAGCPILTSNIGALPETVGDAGIIIQEKPGTAAYFQKFLAALDRLITDDSLFNRLSNRGRMRAKEMSWEKSAVNFLEYLQFVHGIK